MTPTIFSVIAAATFFPSSTRGLTLVTKNLGLLNFLKKRGEKEKKEKIGRGKREKEREREIGTPPLLCHLRHPIEKQGFFALH